MYFGSKNIYNLNFGQNMPIITEESSKQSIPTLLAPHAIDWLSNSPNPLHAVPLILSGSAVSLCHLVSPLSIWVKLSLRRRLYPDRRRQGPLAGRSDGRRQWGTRTRRRTWSCRASYRCSYRRARSSWPTSAPPSSSFSPSGSSPVPILCAPHTPTSSRLFPSSITPDSLPPSWNWHFTVQSCNIASMRSFKDVLKLRTKIGETGCDLVIYKID